MNRKKSHHTSLSKMSKCTVWVDKKAMPRTHQGSMSKATSMQRKPRVPSQGSLIIYPLSAPAPPKQARGESPAIRASLIHATRGGDAPRSWAVSNFTVRLPSICRGGGTGVLFSPVRGLRERRWGRGSPPPLNPKGVRDTPSHHFRIILIFIWKIWIISGKKNYKNQHHVYTSIEIKGKHVFILNGPMVLKKMVPSRRIRKKI